MNKVYPRSVAPAKHVALSQHHVKRPTPPGPPPHSPVVHHPAVHKSNHKVNHPAPHNQPRKHAAKFSKKLSPHKAALPHNHNKPAAQKPKSSAPQKKAPQSPARPKIVLLNGSNNFEANARAANMARQQCKAVSDCHCPTHPNAKMIKRSTSCINGFCSCDNPVVDLFAGEFMEAVKAIGNSPITKAVGQLMQGLADVKQVLGTIAGAFLGPAAKAALKVRRFFDV